MGDEDVSNDDDDEDDAKKKKRKRRIFSTFSKFSNARLSYIDHDELYP